MAHELYKMENGEFSMAYVGEMPWHGHGQKVNPDEPLEVWAKKAHLDWSVDMTDVKYQLEGSPLATFKGRKVLFRTDDLTPLSVVSSIYKPVQPLTVLGFFEKLIKNHGFKMHTAGSLQGGRRVWALADMSREFRIFGQDQVKAFLLLATSYDLSLATVACFTSTRVVCNNTLQWAYNRDGDGEHAGSVRVPHFSVFDADKVHFDLGIVDKSWQQFTDDAVRMAERHVTQDEAVKFFMDLYHNPKKGDDYSDVPNRTIAKLMLINEVGVGQDTKSAKGTLWGLVNAVSRFVDHEKGERVSGGRLNAAWFGNGATLKSKAWADALAFDKAA